MQPASVVVVVVVGVAVVAVVLGTDEPHSPMLLTDDARISTRGNPDAIGTAMLPLESTVIDVQVYISTSLAPDEYPLPLKDNV